MVMKNPFVTNGYAGPEYFCDRVEETQHITEMLTNENNMALDFPSTHRKDRADSPLLCPASHPKRLLYFYHRHLFNQFRQRSGQYVRQSHY